MSDVKIWYWSPENVSELGYGFVDDEPAPAGRPCSRPLVDKSDFDRVTAERDAALGLSVTKIMLDIVPGYDGMGEEVYAKSVEDIEHAFTKLYDEVERLTDQRDALQQRLTAAEFNADYRHGMLEKVAQGWACKICSEADALRIGSCDGLTAYGFENGKKSMAVYDPEHMVFSDAGFVTGPIHAEGKNMVFDGFRIDGNLKPFVFTDIDASKNNDPISEYPVCGECPECINPAEGGSDEGCSACGASANEWNCNQCKPF